MSTPQEFNAEQDMVYENCTPMDFCNDGEYSDKEMTDCLSGVVKNQYEKHLQYARSRQDALLDEVIETLSEFQAYSTEYIHKVLRAYKTKKRE